MANSGDQKSVNNSLARIKKMVLGESNSAKNNSDENQTNLNPHLQKAPVYQNDEGAVQNLSRKGVLDNGGRTPLTDYVSQHMPHVLEDVQIGDYDAPTADNGYNEPHHRATTHPIAEHDKPAPFVSGISDYQLKSKQSEDDEIPQAVINTLLQSHDKGKVHIRSGKNAPAFTSPHSMQLSMNRENRDILEGKLPDTTDTVQDHIEQQNPSSVWEHQTDNSTTNNPTNESPLVLTDVITLTDIVEESSPENPMSSSENEIVPTETPLNTEYHNAPKQETLNTHNEQNNTSGEHNEANTDDGVVTDDIDTQVLERIRKAMESLKQTQLEKAPFDTAMTKLVHDEVRPYIKQWLNKNLANVVETHVEQKIQNIINTTNPEKE